MVELGIGDVFFVLYSFIMKRLVFLSYLIIGMMWSASFSTVYSQDISNQWDEMLTDEEIDWETVDNLLSDIQLQPLQLSTLTKSQLEQFPFLSDRLIENILYYIYRYQPIRSLKELRGVEGMTERIYRYLTPYLQLDNTNGITDSIRWRSWFKSPRILLISRLKIPFNQRAGYADYSYDQIKQNPNIKYLGANFYHNIRARINFSQHINIGINMEKDEGEPLFGRYAPGYDFYSGYIGVKDVGWLSQLIVGDYKAAFGYGLVMNTHFYLGKNLTAAGFHRMAKGISPSNSLQEYGYFRGLAAEFSLTKRLKYSAGISFIQADGRVDSLFIKSLITDGKHRLISERKRHNTISNFMVINALYYNQKQYELGLTAVYNHFNKVLNPDYRSYNKYYPRGNDFVNYSLLYKFFFNRLIVSGELAADRQPALAWQNRISYQPNVNNSIFIINRYYDRKYQSIFGNAFRENSQLQNEIGTLIGFENNSLRNLNILLTTDVFYFPYLRYRVSKSGTWGIDINTIVHYSPSYSLRFMLKGGYKSKYRDYHPDKLTTLVIPHGRSRVVAEMQYQFSEQWILKNNVQWVHVSDARYRQSNGWMFGSGMSGGWGSRLRFSVSGTLFSADDYDARLYAYEPGMLYTYSGYSVYDRGVRGALLCKYDWDSHFQLQMKLGATHYFDKDRIGTGTETIIGKNVAGFELQFRYMLKPFAHHRPRS